MKLIFCILFVFPICCSCFQVIDNILKYINYNYNYKYDLSNKFEYSICKKDISSFELKSLVLTPNPPEKGKKLSIKLNGDLLKSINSGSLLRTVVKYQRIVLFRSTFDVCKELEKPDNKLPIKCPIEIGEKTLDYEVDLPDNLPNGKFSVDAELLNENKDLIFCTKIQMIFM